MRRVTEEDRGWIAECAAAGVDWFCDAEAHRRFDQYVRSQPRRLEFLAQDTFFQDNKHLSPPVLALIAAEEVRYMGITRSVPATLVPLVAEFHSVDPTHPSRLALEKLVNALLSHVRPGVIFKPSEPMNPDDYDYE